MINIINLTLIHFFTDSDCQDICVLGGCSESCSPHKRCSINMACMSGRCYSSCNIGSPGGDSPLSGGSVEVVCSASSGSPFNVIYRLGFFGVAVDNWPPSPWVRYFIILSMFACRMLFFFLLVTWEVLQLSPYCKRLIRKYLEGDFRNACLLSQSYVKHFTLLLCKNQNCQI